jgi:hypothetical protein
MTNLAHSPKVVILSFYPIEEDNGLSEALLYQGIDKLIYLWIMVDKDDNDDINDYLLYAMSLHEKLVDIDPHVIITLGQDVFNFLSGMVINDVFTPNDLNLDHMLGSSFTFPFTITEHNENKNYIVLSHAIEDPRFDIHVNNVATTTEKALIHAQSNRHKEPGT